MSFIERHGPGILNSLIGSAAPSIARGALVELLKQKGVTVEVIIQWVQEKRSLWSQIGPEDRGKLKRMISKVGDVSWLTTDWAIGAVRKDLPGVASLFMGWPKAKTWLDRQIKELQRELVS